MTGSSAAVKTASRRVRFADPLRNREFRAIFAADIQSAIGDQFTRLALVVLVYSRTGSVLLTGLLYALTFLPSLIGSVALAGLADRFPRRSVMISIDIARAMLVAAMSLTSMPLALTFVLVFVIGVLAEPFTAAVVPLVAEIFEEDAGVDDIDRQRSGDIYAMASTLRTAAHQGSQLLGFATAGILLTFLAPATLLLSDAASFAVTVVLVGTFVRRRAAPGQGRGPGQAAGPTADPAADYFASVRSGFATIFASPALRSLVGMAWAVGFIATPVSLAAPYADGIGAGALGTGLLMASVPAGATVGMLVLRRTLDPAQCRRAIAPLAATSGLPLVACVFTPGLGISLALWFASGALTAYFAQIMPELMARTPADRRARTIGAVSGGLTAAQGVCVLAAALLGLWLPTGAAVALCGALGVGVTTPLALRWRELVRHEESGEPVLASSLASSPASSPASPDTEIDESVDAGARLRTTGGTGGADSTADVRSDGVPLVV